MKVLIIDGSRIFRRIIGNLFLKLGYELIVAENIKIAKSLLKKHHFNLILIANELDDGLGMKFAKVCRERKLIPSETPIFLTTTSSLSNEYIREVLASGVTEILSKNNVKLIYDQLESFATRKLINDRAISCNILYIEDELTTATQTCDILQSMGAKVFHFTGTDGVYNFLLKNPVDLIVSDVFVDGEESVLSLIYRLRSSYTIDAIIPILIITGSDNLSRRIEFFHLGIDDYLIKPVIDIELLARVKNLLIKRQYLELFMSKTEKLAMTKVG